MVSRLTVNQVFLVRAQVEEQILITMKRKDVREVDTWVFSDYDHNIKCEGTFDEVSKFSKNAPSGYMMSKSLYSVFVNNRI